MEVTDQNTRITDSDVTINVIKVNGRVMTPVLFRQLPRKALLDRRSNKLNGVPWGKVNYYWGSCKAGQHLHILWVDNGGDLCRDCVYRSRGRDEPLDDEWTQYYNRLCALPQLYIDGDHSEVHA